MAPYYVILYNYHYGREVPTWGVVIDGQLADVGTFGVQNLTTKVPVSDTTAFRIASMTKSFTVLAILKLRDQGKLSLEDHVSKWIPEFAKIELRTPKGIDL
jgi:CubicO group peptidase (beta-lactamase class C family)